MYKNVCLEISLKKYLKCRSVQSIMGANETGYRFGILPYFSNIKELDYQNIVPNPSVKNPLNDKKL
ncbi:conserved hypothetical protein [Leptospira interrogans serovar Manilae]|uniref:Uncharacterized protein n=10 Tax=Leptospira interrogans TaxID=173 RepID=A0AAQ1SMJ5_LEPIR|nr:conserved hypothetical protein [Leptospira interrogans serovar Manilae]